MKQFIALSVVFLSITVGATYVQGADSSANPAPFMLKRHDAHMTLTTTAFPDGGVIGDANMMHSGQGAPSPDLTWSNPPAGTQSYALIMHDMDVVPNVSDAAQDGTHWLVFNIPASTTSLPAGIARIPKLPDGAIQPLNRKIYGYSPPGAPPAFYHHYVIELYALDTKLDLGQNATREDILKGMDGHILDRATLFGRSHL